MKAVAFGLGNFCVVIILAMLKQKRQLGKKAGDALQEILMPRALFFSVSFLF